MKKVILFAAFILSVSMAFGQSNQSDLVEKATQEMVSAYELNAEQTTEMQKIQARKYRNLAEIEPLKKTDEDLYLQKLQSLEYGTDMSVMRLFKDNKTQWAAFNKERGERRLAKSNFQQEMREKGLEAKEIEAKYWEQRLADF